MYPSLPDCCVVNNLWFTWWQFTIPYWATLHKFHYSGTQTNYMLHKNVQFIGSYKYSKYNIHTAHPTAWDDQGPIHLKQVCISTITVHIMINCCKWFPYTWQGHTKFCDFHSDSPSVDSWAAMQILISAAPKIPKLLLWVFSPKF
jgi:hypothetical protein